MRKTTLLIPALLLLTLVAVAPAQDPPTGTDTANVKCTVCGMINCQMGCKAENVNAQGERVMVMPGIPDWMFYGGIGAILAVSFIVAEIVGRKPSHRTKWRFNVLKFKPLKAIVRKPYFQFMLQAPLAVLFLLLIYIGLFGRQDGGNITPALTWTIWWATLIGMVMLLGKTWCLICPWDLLATSLSRLKFWGTGPGALNLGLKWPKPLSNIAMAIVLFVVLTWLELGYHITSSPKYTAYMAIGVLVLSIIPMLLFERKSYCRHGCFVGRISGLYATFAPVEVRAADREICKSCRTRDCYVGNDKGNPCPTGLCLATLEDNTYCLKCTECVRSCPNDNVAINIRPFAEDLFNYTGPRLDEAILAVVLLSMTSFHGLTMTPFWENVTAPEGTIIGWITEVFGTGRLTSFTIGMTAVLVAPMLLYVGFCMLARSLGKWLGPKELAGAENVSTMKIFIQFSYSVLPIALFYHVAHNGMHLFMEGQNVIPLLSDPMGYGWDLFGTASWRNLPPILGKDIIWTTQVLLVIIGHVFGIIISQKTSRKLFGEGRLATVVQVPLLAAMIIFSFMSLWIMHLDMNMRGTLM
ncbi:MAG: hypothetical protein GY794_10475 [bacterium]|nr:hypothetical protein [bacterium]